MAVKYFLIFILLLSGCSFTEASDSTQNKINNSSFISLMKVSSQRNDDTLQLTADKFGKISLNESFDESKLQLFLAQSFNIRSGIAIVNKTLRKYHQISRAKELLATFYVDENKRIEKIEIFSPQIVTVDKVAVNSQFRQLFHSGKNVCHWQYDMATEIECKSPSTSSIHYIMTGQWHGSTSILPSDDVLGGWRIKRIIWLNH